MTISISELYAGEYFSAADIPREGMSATILGIREDIIGEQGKKPKVLLAFRDHDKELALNKTNAMTLSEHYGDDASRWIGKVVHFSKGKTTYMGKPVDAIFVSADNNGVPF